ncbi:MAG: (2Fe-2S) ferredoxin domain-containing protein [Pseudomonadota bacterium]
MFPSYKHHVFICQNERAEGHVRGCCSSKGSAELLTYMKARVKELGIQDIRINKSGCLNECEKGPVMVIYPEGKWFCVKNTDDVDAILKQIQAT